LGDSVLVVGDAAGTADPIDGGGIFNALVNGEVAGKVAVEALEAENVTAEFLSIYEDIWKKTENYRLLQRNYLLRRMALEANVNIGVFLNQMGFFEGYDSLL
jgi:flavin-dependent dehydrogenase